MSKLYERDCRICGKHFTAKDGRVRICQNPHPFTCENCGEVFYTKNNSFRKTCSQECQMEQTFKPRNKVYERECSGCGAHFTTDNHRLRFCQKPHPYTCENCGDVFYTDGPKRKTCSKECQWEQTNAKMSKLRETDEFKEKHKASLNNAEVQAKRQASMEQTLQERYGEGITNPGQLDWVQEKMKETNKEKYGTEYALQSKEVQDKVKATNLERYGVENPGGLKETYEKIKQTNMERYGVKHSGQLERIRKANSERLSDPDMQLKMQKAYAEANDIDDFDYHERINDEDWQNLEEYLANNKGSLTDHADHFNISVRAMRRKIIREDLTRYIEGFHDYSSDEFMVAEMLQELGMTKDIDFRVNHRKSIPPYEIDFYLNDHNIGIEVSPRWHHRLEVAHSGYHSRKSIMADEVDLRLLTQFDWISDNSVLNFVLRHTDPESIPELEALHENEVDSFENNSMTNVYSPSGFKTLTKESDGKYISVRYTNEDGVLEIYQVASNILAKTTDLINYAVGMIVDYVKADKVYFYSDRALLSNLDIPENFELIEYKIPIYSVLRNTVTQYDYKEGEPVAKSNQVVETCGYSKWRVM